MTSSRLEKALHNAWVMAEDYNEGSILVQYLRNGTYLITHQIGNSFPNLGSGWSDSENRIVIDLDCRYYEPQYYEDSEGNEEPHIPENRLSPEEQDDTFYDMINEIEEHVNELRKEARAK